MRPDENILYGGAVSGGAASGFSDDWLVDGVVNKPAKATTGTQTWTVTPLVAGTVDFIAVANHNIDAARTITIGGDVSATLAGPAARANGINVNPWAQVSSVAGVDNITIGVSGNSSALTIGEFFAGKLRESSYGMRVRTPFTPSYSGIRHETDGGTALIYELPFVRRGISTSMGADDSDLEQFLAWFEAARANTRPSVIIPFDDQQDAWVVEFLRLTYEPILYQSSSSATYMVTMEFAEFPRYRF